MTKLFTFFTMTFNSVIFRSVPVFFILTVNVLSQSYFPSPESLILLRSNLEYLASDKLEGREATTKGEEMAAKFISDKLFEYGVKPFAGDGSYFQNFSVDVKWADRSSWIELSAVDGSVSHFNVGDDFYLSTAIIPSMNFCGEKSEILFAGFGITAPEYEYDDYKGLDVDGKVVLVYRGAPKQDGDNLFSGEAHKKYIDPKYKIKNAAKHGAKGVLIIPGDFAERYWDWVKRGALSSTFTLSENNTSYEESIPSVLLSVEAVTELLEKEPYSYEDLTAALEHEEIPEWFLLSKKVTFSYKVYQEKRTSKNIIGIINGTDDNLKNEFVSIGAHYDHEGIVDGEIYNGADDNASGTVAVLDAGRRLAQLKNNKRSILIIFHAAEEKGLLGSKYLTANSSFIDNIIVNINLDMVGREHIDTIYSVGSGKISSELKEIVEETNEETVNFNFNYKFDDPNDPLKIYYRSDHYNYAKRGIPIVFFYDYMVEDYHKPTDDADKINYKKIEKVTSLITEIAQRVANLEHSLTKEIEIEKVEVE